MIYFTDIIKVAPALSEPCFSWQRSGMRLMIFSWEWLLIIQEGRFGKFVPWLVIRNVDQRICICNCIYRFSFIRRKLCVFASIIYVLWGMTYTIMDIPYWSVIPNLTSDPQEREKVSVLPRILQVSDSH